MTHQESDDGIPHELKEKLATFDTHLSQLEGSLSHLLEVPRAEIVEKVDPMELSKTDLVSAYAVNALFWMYLNINGTNPKDHGVKQELARIQSYMGRVKEIESKKIEKEERAKKVDMKAARRFIRSAMWQAAQKKDEDGPPPSAPSRDHDDRGSGPSKKRRRDDR